MGLVYLQPNVGVNPKIGGEKPPNPKSFHFNRVWNHYFHPSILGGFPPIFGNTHVGKYSIIFQSHGPNGTWVSELIHFGNPTSRVFSLENGNSFIGIHIDPHLWIFHCHLCLMTGKLYTPEKSNLGFHVCLPGCNFCFFFSWKKLYLYYQGWQSGIALRYTSSQVFHLVLWQHEANCWNNWNEFCSQECHVSKQADRWITGVRIGWVC